MKLHVFARLVLIGGRPPRGGRGLKPSQADEVVVDATSPPARGAWIETQCEM